jgi:hypothetical protein
MLAAISSLLSSLPITVQSINELPGSNTYFRTSDVRPYVQNGVLFVYNARGQRRSWGTPSVDSKVKALSATVIKVTVTGWHKHTVGPVGGDYYFVLEAGEWTRRTANHKAVKAVL